MSSILVTGIGGNVGYGILKNISRDYPGMLLVGTNTVRVSAGNHLCHRVYEVPFATDAAYVPAIQRICEDHQVALIIPATDYESYVLAAHAAALPVVAGSPAETAGIFLDKFRSWQRLSLAGLTFAESVLPSEYNGQFARCIVKPREGRGSRNVYYDPGSPGQFSDDFIVQPMLAGREITTAFYITKANALLGHITLTRELAAGATNICEVTREYDREMEQYIRKLTDVLEIRGACNIQSIVTDSGIIPFEVNCRISGTNSIRSHFGFRDVAYTVEEYFFNRKPEVPEITTGSAIRMLSDIIYPGISLHEIQNNSDHFIVYE